jgi:hypothetical protein
MFHISFERNVNFFGTGNNGFHYTGIHMLVTFQEAEREGEPPNELSPHASR